MIKNFKAAIAYLEALIPQKREARYQGKIGLLRQKYLLKLLGNPQDQYPCIHITGTSGKSSTAYLIAAILKEAGYRVGLHISPHLKVITERVQINNQNLSQAKFVSLVNRLVPVINQVSQNPKFGTPTYFEALVALTFLAFLKEAVDIAVIEVGMGGKFDGTNVLKRPLISVITNIGLDHTQVLGETVEKIAHDKKKIIKSKSLVISAASQRKVREIITRECLKKNSRLYLLNRDFHYRVKQMNSQGEVFDFWIKTEQWKNLKLSLLGLHQVENASLAILAVKSLETYGFTAGEAPIRQALVSAFFPGRLEIIRLSPLVVFDGAHNQAKMRALTTSFPRLFSYRKLIVVFALKKNKNLATIFPPIAQIASFIIVTRFTIGQDLGLNLSYPPQKLATSIKEKFNYRNLEVEPSPEKAFKKALAMQGRKDAVLVTGSLYLVAELKKRDVAHHTVEYAKKNHINKIQRGLRFSMSKEHLSKKGHQKGWQWRENPRALEKKRRSKTRHFGLNETKVREEAIGREFLIGRENEKLEVGVVAANKSGRFNVLFQGEYQECILDPEVSFDWNKRIVVGDYVTLKQNEGRYMIDHLVERRTALSRLRRDSTHWGTISTRGEHVIAANVDVAVIVAAVKNPPFHPKFVDRYLVLVQHGGIKPVICLNKCDLPTEETEILGYYQNIGIPVVRTSAEENMGIEELKAEIVGRSAVLVGHSGVGKSSLINRIYPEADLRVGYVAEKTGKGRHTTTVSELLVWEDNSYLIDTPGVRSLGMWDIERQDLQLYFDDINQLAVDCKFNDCLHDKVTPEICGVVRAVDDGRLPLQRYESYVKILREL